MSSRRGTGSVWGLPGVSGLRVFGFRVQSLEFRV